MGAAVFSSLPGLINEEGNKIWVCKSSVGTEEGGILGFFVGSGVGVGVGACVGDLVGSFVGAVDGVRGVGELEGNDAGGIVGERGLLPPPNPVTRKLHTPGSTSVNESIVKPVTFT